MTDAQRALHADHDLLLLDLDGVVYVGPHAVPGAVQALAAVTRDGAVTGYATNNASRTPQEVAAHLGSLGVPVQPEQVTTSSQAAALLVRERLGSGARVLPVGGPGVRAALLEAGLVPVGAPEERPDAVVQGFGRQVGWTDLADAAVAVRAGALWVATNTDPTLPTERGPAPGNGSLVGAVRNAVDVDPLVAGKPEPGLFASAARRAAAAAPLVVGDRLDTDVAGAHRAGMASLLVLTGVSTPLEALLAPAHQRPEHVGADLGALLQPPARAEREGDWWRCGPAVARVADRVVTASLDDSAAPRGPASTEDLLALLRAACAAVRDAEGRDAAAPADGAAAPGNGVAALHVDGALVRALELLRARCTARG
ncbi:HAD-IIA family hydrolase [Quadrisphaera sp. DSM 44207]|uniref:HAD-IIA family hydrolase n=1 Tax=Quadrisphaera sp. DSM 44207 TaxID=1881057 RepID=UPI000880303F|nr:HAD-IIA family hydrolase [Quadrisphaera sp. DSM 44207]SDQ51292.1 Haloacid Dehalogenase Superfamily Class (subfamily) IIA [Quadrisphaera sp. DSM 44207]